MPWKPKKPCSYPLCPELIPGGQTYCLRGEIVKEASIVDHIIPIKKGGDLMVTGNLQSLCVSCHNRKKAKEMRI
jgi:5-methylcytosine-specific restriction endonuclease McrA